MAAKYELGLLVIIKNERMVIREFIEHYKWQGVEHFYVIDNGSNDNTKEILDPYIEQGIMTYEHLGTPHRQTHHYNYMFGKYGKECDWLIICDADEYIYARCDGKNIRDELRVIGQDVSAVTLSWKMFASNGHIEQPPCIRTGFTKRGSVLSQCFKSIVRTKYVARLDVHEHRVTQGRRLHDPDCLALNHYAIMSWEYFEKVKMTRGDVLNSKTDNHRNRAYFEAYDKYSDVDDMELSNLLINQRS